MQGIRFWMRAPAVTINLAAPVSEAALLMIENKIGGFVTITGGKATTCRAMAEKTADIVCAKLGVVSPCRTREVPLLSYRQYYSARGA